MRPRPSKNLNLGLEFRGFSRLRVRYFYIFEVQSRLRVAKKLKGFLRVSLEEPSNFEATPRVTFSRIFEDSSKNLEKMTYFGINIALKSEVFRGSSKNRKIYPPEVFSRVSLKTSNFEAEASNSKNFEKISRIALEQVKSLRYF